MKYQPIHILSSIMLWAGMFLCNCSSVYGKPPQKLGRPLRVAYFVPSDCVPEQNYAARLDRVMTHIQAFYRNGMRANGLTPMTFNLNRGDANELDILVVKGRDPKASYNRDSAEKIRAELRAAFSDGGLDFEQEVVVVFQVLLDRQPGKTTEIGPFKGGGNGYKGSALVYDDIRLDAALLNSKQQDTFSAPGKTIGDFNSGYIGGTAHELGHAFGIGHDAERPTMQARLGRSLMGRGNHDYGEELRGKSKGAFLSVASALPLSVHPLFTHQDLDQDLPDFAFTELTATQSKNGLLLAGGVKGKANAKVIVAYNDADSDPSDYDAVGWPAAVNRDGTFRILVSDLVKGTKYSLSSLLKKVVDQG